MRAARQLPPGFRSPSLLRPKSSGEGPTGQTGIGRGNSAKSKGHIIRKMKPTLSLLKGEGIVIFDPKNFAESEHRVRIEARILEQSFVTNASLEATRICDESEVKPRDSRRQRLTSRIDRHD